MEISREGAKDIAAKGRWRFFAKIRETFMLRAFAFFKIPMLHFMGPVVEEISDERCVVRIPLYRRTRNHLKSMYFAVLAAGADCAGGLIALRFIRKSGGHVSLVFKDFKAEFLKRAEADVWFTCEDGPAIRDLVAEAISSGQRVQRSINITATVPSKLGSEPVAKFEMTLSLKAQG
ncbi:MAG: PaaI family thioesterase [Syntrophales bacterium]